MMHSAKIATIKKKRKEVTLEIKPLREVNLTV